jgi:hypothetical protein
MDLRATLLGSWRTSARTTELLTERPPAEIWPAALPGAPRRTVRGLAAHLHNTRLRWIRTLGAEHGIRAREAAAR